MHRGTAAGRERREAEGERGIKVTDYALRSIEKIRVDRAETGAFAVAGAV